MRDNPNLSGCMLVPIIAGSDKTTVSVATGQNDYYPLYMSIGNIDNETRQAHGTGLVVIGFLAITKSKHVTSMYRSELCLIHVKRRRNMRLRRILGHINARSSTMHWPMYFRH